MKFVLFLITFLLLNLMTPAQAANRVALLIGNQQYQNDKPLKNPVRDVNLIANALQKVGFRVIKRNNLTRRQIKKALRELHNSLQAGDVALVYYSGHGLQYSNDNYIIPIDADISLANEIPDESMSTQQILGYMGQAATRIVILDACRNNPYQTGGKGIGKGLKRQTLTSISNTLIAFAAAPNEEALDGHGSNSPYALALANYIGQPGLGIESVFRGVRKQVRTKTGNKQTPWYNASMDNEFYFKQSHVVNPPSLVPNLSDNSETIFWNIVSQKNTAGYYQAYLDKYGDRGLYYQFALLETNRLANQITPAQTPATAQLTVKTSPANARVRILNIGPKYKDNIELKPGRYHLEASLSGYQRHTEWITLEAENKVHSVVLTALPEPAVAVYQPATQANSRTTSSQKRRDHQNGIEMIRIDPGCFQMGSDKGGDETKHRVCLSNGYYMGKYEVTQAQWQSVMGSHPSHFKCQQCPVEQVSWEDAQDFLRKLNRQSGLQYRLPTEAEWEYACRSGGREQTYCGGNSIANLAWYNGNASSKTHPVGGKQANGLGLYDMSGNVWEWVSDGYDRDYYQNSPVNDPRGPSGGSRRVFRGGSWFISASYARSAYRYYFSPDFRDYNLGFRLARTKH